MSKQTGNKKIAKETKTAKESSFGFFGRIIKKITTKQMVVHAPAKINLTLDVLGKREDGYHTLRTIMQTVNLCDDVKVCVTNDCAIRLSLSDDTLPANNKNTAYKAAEVFFKHLEKENPGVEITIEKKIPSQAGMGGASTDAAAVLYALNELYGEPFTLKDLAMFGNEVGADVPFCVIRGCALAMGTGNYLKPIFGLPKKTIVVVCKPTGVSVSTKEAYEAIDAKMDSVSRSREQDMIADLIRGNVQGVAEKLYNNFEEALPIKEVQDVLDQMHLFDCLGCRMTGSGSACYALFDKKEKATACATALESLGEVFVCHPC